MRLLMSGAALYDHKTKEHFYASPEVTQFFSDNPLIQKSMGYNYEAINQATRGPSVPFNQVPISDGTNVPENLKRIFPRVHIHQLEAFNLNAKERVTNGTFVMVSYFI